MDRLTIGNDKTNNDILFDEFCDPNNPINVSTEAVLKARQIVKNGVIRTPFTRSRLSEELGMDLYFKKEFMQYTGSFKERGALFALSNLSTEDKFRGVVTTSAGNHSQALTYQGSKLGVPVTVFMPGHTPVVKVESCKNLGANVIVGGIHFDEARANAMQYCRDNNLKYINGYDHEDIIAGQGTMALEMIEEVPDLDYLIVPIGGGGMIAGCVAALKNNYPHIKILGVESNKCPAWTTATKAGRPVVCTKSKGGASNTIADGLAVVQVGVNAFETCRGKLDRVVALEENYISLAVVKLLQTEKAVTEGAGATGLAAILSGAFPELKGKKVGCVLCGGNIDMTSLQRVIERGLAMDGRAVKFHCDVTDRSGGLNALLEILADHKANIKDLSHDRTALPRTVYKVRVTCTAETIDREQSLELKGALEEAYGEDLQWEDMMVANYNVNNNNKKVDLNNNCFL